MKVLYNILAALYALFIIGPIRSIRIIRRGAQRVAAFRAMHGREPTEAEWVEISGGMEAEILHDHGLGNVKR